jgi:hypothetical protein
MHASATHAGARTLFERARRVLAGHDEPAPPQEGPVDIRFGIDRVLRNTRKPKATPGTVEEAAARAVTAVEGTLVAIDTINEYLMEALDLTTEALKTSDPAKRAMIADRYEELRSNIDTVAAGASFQGVNLIGGRRARPVDQVARRALRIGRRDRRGPPDAHRREAAPRPGHRHLPEPGQHARAAPRDGRGRLTRTLLFAVPFA